MRVDAVERGDGRMHLLQIAQVVVDEVGQWLGWIHASACAAMVEAPSQWYLSTVMPGTLFWSRRPSATSRTSRCAALRVLREVDSDRRRRHAAHGQVLAALRDHHADVSLHEHNERAADSAAPGAARQRRIAWRSCPTPARPASRIPALTGPAPSRGSRVPMVPVPGRLRS